MTQMRETHAQCVRVGRYVGVVAALYIPVACSMHVLSVHETRPTTWVGLVRCVDTVRVASHNSFGSVLTAIGESVYKWLSLISCNWT